MGFRKRLDRTVKLLDARSDRNLRLAKSIRQMSTKQWATHHRDAERAKTSHDKLVQEQLMDIVRRWMQGMISKIIANKIRKAKTPDEVNAIISRIKERFFHLIEFCDIDDSDLKFGSLLGIVSLVGRNDLELVSTQMYLHAISHDGDDRDDDESGATG